MKCFHMRRNVCRSTHLDILPAFNLSIDASNVMFSPAKRASVAA